MSDSCKVVKEFAAECLAVAKSKGISEGVFAKAVVEAVKGVCFFIIVINKKPKNTTRKTIILASSKPLTSFFLNFHNIYSILRRLMIANLSATSNKSLH